MTNFTSTHKFSAAAAFGAAALFSMISFGSNAEAASVSSCKGASATNVASCCEKVVAQKGRPLWMIQSRTDCREVVKCMYRQCYVQVVYAVDDGGPEDGGGRRGRGIK